MAKVEIELKNGRRKLVSERDAKILLSLKKATLVDTAKEPELAPDPEPIEPVPSPPAKKVTKRVTKTVRKQVEAEPVPERPKRAYRRRDMAGKTEAK